MRTFAFCCAAIVFGFTAAATAGSTNSNWFARTWQTEDGLPNNNVNSLAQTPDGFLWIATPLGLSRFDGVSFDEIFLTNFVGTANRGVKALLRSDSGGLRFEMDRGEIVNLSTNKVMVIHPTNELPDLPARTLVEDDDGTLWISYVGGAVCFLKNGETTAVTPQMGLPWSAVSSIAKDTDGRIWLARGGEIGLFRGGRFQSLIGPGSRPVCLAAAREGGIWICQGNRLSYFGKDSTLKDVAQFTTDNPRVEPSVMLEDRSGGIWVGTAYDGLFHFDGNRFEKVAISHPEISSLLEDYEGNIWVGTHGGGLNRLHPRAITLENVQTGLPFNAVQSVCEDAGGTVWAVTENGLLAWRGTDGWQTATNVGGPDNIATCVASNSDGSIWIGTRNHRLLRLRNGHIDSFGKSRGLEVSPISALMVGSNGDLWIGGFNHQLQSFRDGYFTDVPLSENTRTIRAIVQDANGKIWIGTSRGFLLQINGTNAVDETEEISGSEKSIRCLYASPDGSLWIGYAGFGLGRFKAGHFSRITTAQGLFDDYISQIVPDGHGWFWFGADRGIFKVREQELIDASENPGTRVRSIHYGRGEGLPSLQADFGFATGAIRSRDGRIWIPTRSALAVINPQSSDDVPTSPPVFLKRVSVDGQTIAAYRAPLPPGDIPNLRKSTGLRLPPDHRKIEFDFAALNFSAPENVRLQYRLDGLDSDWIDANPERIANYSRLPAGNYCFRIRAGSSAGVWNNAGIAFPFTVTPFLWQQWWFQMLAIILFVAIVIVVVRYISFRRLRSRLHTLEQQAALDKERARIARDLHDDLGSHMTKIVLLSDLMVDYHHEPDKSDETAQRISATARQVIKTLDETVWAVNPRNDTLPHLIDYMGQFAVEFLRTAGIRCHVDMPLRVPERNVSTELRHNLFMVVKEAMTNIVNHANATEAWLKITTSERDVCIVIEDNGCGFDHAPACVSEAGTLDDSLNSTAAGGSISSDKTSTQRRPDNGCADGLRNMRLRIEEIGGRFDLQSKPAAGTRIAITTPLNK